MALNFKFPDVGEGIHEGKLVKWLVKEGDQIKEDASLAEVETDKAVVEIPSPKTGFILKTYFKEGDVIKVGQTLVTIGEKG
ncbi:MAG: biotin/lipoyl-containing protein, partial [Candidatus Micrarchaeota archaeon]